MNEIAILSFANGILEISSNGSNKQYNTRLEGIISKIAGEKVKLVLVDNDEIKLGFKNSMIENFKESDLWKKLEDKFHGVKLVDLVHKDWM